MIGKQLKDGSILAVYCHWDGYPAFNGRILRDHHNTEEKVNKLIDGGFISSLHTNVGWNNETLPETGPQYYTSRGESIEANEPLHFKDLNEFLCSDDLMGAEYTYHFTDAGWVCHDLHPGPDSHMVKEVKIPDGPVA